MAKIVVLATGGTIAGVADAPGSAVHYRAAQHTVQQLLQQVPGLNDALQGHTLQAVQLAQIDSKDMDHAHWQLLLQACAAALEQADVRGVLITHGTDTLEETATFLEHALAAAPQAGHWRGKPVVLTCAMRPANARQADGPQNLIDALAVINDARAQGVLAVCAGQVLSAADVRKVQPYRLDAFSAGDAGVLGWVEEGTVRWLRQQQPALRSNAVLWQALTLGDPAQWPWVELVASGAGSDGRALRALQQAGVRGVVLASTGNGTLHQALEATALQLQQAGISIWRSSRCLEGAVVGNGAGTRLPLAPHGLIPSKARVALMLELMGADATA